MLSLEQRGLMAIVPLLCGPFCKGNGVAATGVAIYEELEKAAATHNVHVVETSARTAAATYRCLARTSVRSWTTSYWVQVVSRM